MNEIANKLFYLVNEKGLEELNAWNQTSVQLINAARVHKHIIEFFYIYIFWFELNLFFKQIYTDLFVIHANLSCIYNISNLKNQQILSELFELYLLYSITDVYSSNILRVIMLLKYQNKKIFS